MNYTRVLTEILYYDDPGTVATAIAILDRDRRRAINLGILTDSLIDEYIIQGKERLLALNIHQSAWIAESETVEPIRFQGFEGVKQFASRLDLLIRYHPDCVTLVTQSGKTVYWLSPIY